MTTKQEQLVYHATVGIDKCKGDNGNCGATLAYQPNVGEEAECPYCHTVHTIIGGGLLELLESE